MANITAHVETARQRLQPLQMSEIILRTLKYEQMREWYRFVLGGLDPTVEVTTGSDVGARSDVTRVCFFRVYRLFPYTQVLGLFEIPGLQAAPVRAPGMDHMQFREQGMAQLCDRFEVLKAADVVPYRAFNHGPGTSFYYHDPEGNTVEFSAVNFRTEAEYLAYFRTEAYRRNFDGVRIDPEDYVARFRRGVSLEELVRIPG